MSDYGIKVSLPGIDVKTATPEECAVHSGYPSPKIDIDADPLHFGTILVTFPTGMDAGDNLLYDFEHGYSYRPMVLGTAEFSDSGASFEATGILPLRSGGGFKVDLYSTDTKIELYASHNVDDGVIDPGSTLNVNFYVFAEEAE